MIINCDAKQLEWVCAAFLSQDQVAIKEIWEGQDVHSLNQQAFGLPSRLVAKTYLFRLIYGGSAWSYANDPDFVDVGYTEEQWQEVIAATYRKYEGLGAWHVQLVRDVVDGGMIVMPTGRRYIFAPKDAVALRTQILNYPVQGLGADLMSIARVSLAKRMKKLKLSSLLICTVHDSIVVDSVPDEVDQIVGLMFSVFDDIPANFEKLFGVKFNLPMRAEVSVGPNWEETKEVVRNAN